MANALSAKFANPLSPPLMMQNNNNVSEYMPAEIRNSRMLLAAIVDNQGRLLFCNDALRNLIAEHTASHLHYSEIIHHDDLENVRSGLSIALSGKTVSNINTRVISAKGESDHNVMMELSPVPQINGTHQMVLAIATLLPKMPLQKVVDTPDAQMISNLLRRNRDLEQFANIVSHNIRAPLANIMGLNKLMNLNLSPADKEMALKGISVSAEKLENVIKDLNDLLQVRKTDTSVETWVNLVKLVDDIRLSISDTIAKNKATIICAFDEVYEIKSIKSYIQSIFFNLITNAIKYAKPGVPAVVKIGAEMKGNDVIITISDNGTGIDLSRHGSSIFGLYKRFNESVEGKGLGLYMVKTQVESLNGTISVDSTPGDGTTFTITLPT